MEGPGKVARGGRVARRGVGVSSRNRIGVRRTVGGRVGSDAAHDLVRLLPRAHAIHELRREGCGGDGQQRASGAVRAGVGREGTESLRTRKPSEDAPTTETRAGGTRSTRGRDITPRDKVRMRGLSLTVDDAQIRSDPRETTPSKQAHQARSVATRRQNKNRHNSHLQLCPAEFPSPCGAIRLFTASPSANHPSLRLTVPVRVLARPLPLVHAALLDGALRLPSEHLLGSVRLGVHLGSVARPPRDDLHGNFLPRRL